jgi:nucleotide-binding universal stress UspA family protein
LRLAKVVRVLTIVHEKPRAVPGLGADIVRHLLAHGVRAVVDEVDGSKTSFGRVLDDYLPLHSPDLLIMGAYGQSRLREFILGGATEHVLLAPRIPVLMSH